MKHHARDRPRKRLRFVYTLYSAIIEISIPLHFLANVAALASNRVSRGFASEFERDDARIWESLAVEPGMVQSGRQE